MAKQYHALATLWEREYATCAKHWQEKKKKKPQGLETSGTKEVFKNARVPNLIFSYQLNNKG